MARKWLGRRSATKKASATGPAPRIAASIMSRTKPVSRDTRVSPPTVRMRSIIKLPCGINHRLLRKPLHFRFATTDYTDSESTVPMAPSPIVPVLLAGGAGTRLWPVSRDALPKQFLPLVGEFSTYQQALQRVADRSAFAAPIVMTGGQFHFFARHQAEKCGLEASIVIEPVRRDSAAAIAAAAVLAMQQNPDAVVLTLAADHVMLDTEPFTQACRVGRQAADAGHIVTFGITPTQPKTSYGYILRGEPLGAKDAYKLAKFVEKPDVATAARYIAEGYLWNSGNFLF